MPTLRAWDDIPNRPDRRLWDLVFERPSIATNLGLEDARIAAVDQWPRRPSDGRRGRSGGRRRRRLRGDNVRVGYRRNPGPVVKPRVGPGYQLEGERLAPSGVASLTKPTTIFFEVSAAVKLWVARWAT